MVENNHKVYYSISVPRMAPISVFCHYEAEFPYSHFKIRRTGQGSILLNLVTKRN